MMRDGDGSSWRRIAVLLVCGLGFPLTAQGQLGGTISDVIVANSNSATDAGQDRLPRVVADGLGNWIAVWESTSDVGGIGNDADILYARSVDGGFSWSLAKALNSSASSDALDDTNVALATDREGTWIAVWDSDDALGETIGNDSDILFARSTNKGSTWSAASALNLNAAVDSGQDFTPSIATDGEDMWVVVWSSREELGGIGVDQDIFIAISTDDGVNWSVPEVLNLNAAVDTKDDVVPVVETNGSGTWIVAWTTDEDFEDELGSDLDLLFVRTANDFRTFTVPEALNSTAAIDGSDADQNVRLAAGRDGEWVAVWEGIVGFGVQKALTARSADDGLTWSPPAFLASDLATVTGSDFSPNVEDDDAGNFVAVWSSDVDAEDALGSDLDLLIVSSSDGGATWSLAEVFNSNGADDVGDDEFPSVASDGLGWWVTVWESNEAFTFVASSESDILAAAMALPDCNGNGIRDAVDVTRGTSDDCNANGVPDECEPDSDGDGFIDGCSDEGGGGETPDGGGGGGTTDPPPVAPSCGAGLTTLNTMLLMMTGLWFLRRRR